MKKTTNNKKSISKSISIKNIFKRFEFKNIKKANNDLRTAKKIFKSKYRNKKNDLNSNIFLQEKFLKKLTIIAEMKDHYHFDGDEQKNNQKYQTLHLYLGFILNKTLDDYLSRLSSLNKEEKDNLKKQCSENLKIKLVPYSILQQIIISLVFETIHEENIKEETREDIEKMITLELELFIDEWVKTQNLPTKTSLTLMTPLEIKHQVKNFIKKQTS